MHTREELQAMTDAWDALDRYHRSCFPAPAPIDDLTRESLRAIDMERFTALYKAWQTGHFRYYGRPADWNPDKKE